MNDPHVVALIYTIKHPADVDFENAKPLDFDCPRFFGRIENGLLRVELKEHFATHEAANEVVEPFLRAWELHSDLSVSPGEIEFRYQTAEIIDRNPVIVPGTHTVVSLQGISLSISSASASLHVSRSAYPQPPLNLAVDADIEDMQRRFRRFRKDRATLPDTAYFCLTMLEMVGGSRKRAAGYFGIDFKVLDKVGELASNKGGRNEARKAKAVVEYTPQERAWLDAAIKIMIRRAAEVSYDKTSASKIITMADFPPL